jgi:hypothetical protein
MVVVSLQPTLPYMERSGMATGTRKVALRLWNGRLPDGDRQQLVEDLYHAENRDRTEPSGSQDMIGLIYPGISRLDYDIDYAGGYFPRVIESNRDDGVAEWLERILHLVPVAPRPPGYNPLGIKRLDPKWVQRLGETGKECFAAILSRNAAALGQSLNDCMECWARLLPHTVQHETISVDLLGLLRHYQSEYDGAMYSGCGGGYLYVVSEGTVPGGFRVRIRRGSKEP